MAEPQRLPIELCESIIRNFTQGAFVPFREDIKALSLTCKTFLPICRSLIFRDVIVNPTIGKTQLFLNRLSSEQAMASGLASYVRKLKIYDRDPKNHYISSKSSSSWLGPEFVSQLVELFTEVQELQILNMTWRRLDYAVQNAILNGFLKVVNLNLKMSTIDYPEQLEQIIASFPLLMKLNCGDCLPFLLEVPHVSLPKSLECVTLSAADLTPFDRELVIEHHLRPYLRRIVISKFLFPEEVQSLNNFLNLVGSNLRHLTIHFPLLKSSKYSPYYNGYKHSEDTYLGINLGFNDSLSSITIIWSVDKEGPLDILSELFSYLKTNEIQFLNLHVTWCGDEVYGDKKDNGNETFVPSATVWGGFEDFFSEREWDKLERICVKLSYFEKRYGQLDFDAIKNLFPALNNRRLLFPDPHEY